MMKEIRARGPIVADINVPYHFSIYHDGIFCEDEAHAFQLYLNQGNIVNDLTLRDYDIEWEYINHSIVVVGWGVENGEKFWICRNSYGDGFGEQGGHFRVRRGQNDLGIESHPSYYIPRLLAGPWTQ